MLLTRATSPRAAPKLLQRRPTVLVGRWLFSALVTLLLHGPRLGFSTLWCTFALWCTTLYRAPGLLLRRYVVPLPAKTFEG